MRRHHPIPPQLRTNLLRFPATPPRPTLHAACFVRGTGADTLTSCPLYATCTARRKEQSEYYQQTTSWADVHPSQMIGPPACFKTFDLLTVTVEELKAPLKVGGVLVNGVGREGGWAAARGCRRVLPGGLA